MVVFMVVLLWKASSLFALGRRSYRDEGAFSANVLPHRAKAARDLMWELACLR
jgi:hypothetical protein